MKVCSRSVFMTKSASRRANTVAKSSVKQKSGTNSNKNEGFYEALFQSAAVASIIVGEDGTIELANPAFETMSRCSSEEIFAAKRTWKDFIDFDDPAKTKSFLDFMEGAIRPDQKGQKVVFIDKMGIPKNVYAAKASVPGTRQTLISFVKIMEPPPENVETRRDQYRSLVESIDDSIYMLDEECRYLFVNDKVLKRMNITEEEILGKRYDDFHDTKDTREFTSYVAKVFQTGFSHRYEHINKKEENYTLRTLSPVMEHGTRDVKFVTVVSKDITDLKKTEEKLKYLSLHDALTGLYNRAYFEEEMRRLDSSRFDLVGIIVCDIDGLKLINDTLGHEMGDELLVTASTVIRASFRESDVVARVGGDEFAVLIPDSPKSQIEDICKRIKEVVKEYNEQDVRLPLSIATGFAVRTSPSQSMPELYREADNNMYREKLHSSQNARNAIVKNLISTVETKGFVDRKSLKRFQKSVEGLARETGMTGDRIKNIRLLAQFHDIGNVNIHERILAKPTRLTDEEVMEMQKHSDVGHRIAQSAPDLSHISDFILKHHEWWNGKGYPLGLKGEEIPLESRIIAIVDAFEAMTSGRPHKAAMSKKDALKELGKCAGTQFDPALVKKFMKITGK